MEQMSCPLCPLLMSALDYSNKVVKVDFDVGECRWERLSHSLSCLPFVVGESVDLSSGIDPAKVFSGCWGVWDRLSRVASALYLTVSVTMQKKAEYYMYPIGIERWKPTSCSSSAVSFGIRKATEEKSSARTHVRM